jgi:arabinose-5-phosphate isomerase
MSRLLATDLGNTLHGLAEQMREELCSAMGSLDFNRLAQLAQEIVERPALILVGVGKSGLIAEKIAATISSLGLRALAVHPVEAQHGDLGRIQRGDLVLFLSKSGESEELLPLIAPLRSRSCRLWAITSSVTSRLSSTVDGVIELGPSRELDPHNVVPTTSALIQLVIGDLLAMAVWSIRGADLNEFHANHPAGRIGRRLHLRVRDLMLSCDKTPKAHPEQTLLELLEPLSAGRSGCLVLVNAAGVCQGIFTDGDLRRALERRGPAALESMVSEWASLTPRCVPPDLLAIDALRLMEADSAHPISVMPVLEGNTLVGLVRLHDCLQAGL